MVMDQIIGVALCQRFCIADKIGVVGNHTVVMIQHIDRRHIDPVNSQVFIKLLKWCAVAIPGRHQVNGQGTISDRRTGQQKQEIGHMFADATYHVWWVFPTKRKYTHCQTLSQKTIVRYHRSPQHAQGAMMGLPASAGLASAQWLSGLPGR